MGNMKQYRQWKDDNPLLFNKLSEEKRLTQIWYSKISGQLDWKPGEREEIANKSEQVAMEIDHIIGWNELNLLDGYMQKQGS